jgi:VCBS repeat-containing protein
LESGTATVNITVNPVNDAPVASDDSATTDEDTSASIAVLANDTDVDGDALTPILVSAPTNGAVVLNGDGTFTFTPNANFNGSDSFTYKVTDGAVESGIATVSITVNAVNDTPVAADDSATTDEDTGATIAVLANDSDVDGDALTPILVSGPAYGSVVLNADGSFTYTPNANFNGSDSFTYKVSDGTLESGVATVTITVNPVNDAPVAANDNATTDEDNAVIIAVLANDSDVDGNGLSVASVTQGAHGSVAINADGTVKYTPNANFNGADSFTYTISDGNGGTATATVVVTVNAVNDAPVAAGDSASVDEDSSVTITVLGNDSDVDGDTLAAVLVSGPAHGSVVLNADGTFTYKPEANYNGTDSFTYRASDGSLQSGVATVAIAVRSVNDAPVARSESYTVTAGDDLAVAAPGVLGNDTDADGDELTAEVVSEPAHGTLTLNDDGSFIYVPDDGYTGTDSFTYRAGDGSLSSTATVSIEVKADSAPAATAGKVTGAGRTGAGIFLVAVQSNESKRGDLSFKGLVAYHDHRRNLTLWSTAITDFRIESDGRAVISGTATVNGKSGYSFTAYLSDRGESGRKDAFQIVITGPKQYLYESSDYDADGRLDCGNIQVHKAKKKK